ncbi:hypothetical protein H2248_003439 [Termitomyces sp. 'cryptogamus']|nr:hypothetical protein H2248_003439 [Termitomyces sp. 'cryptogamus']
MSTSDTPITHEEFKQALQSMMQELLRRVNSFAPPTASSTAPSTTPAAPGNSAISLDIDHSKHKFLIH